MNNDILIAVLDLYTQQDLNNCLGSIPEDLLPNTLVVSRNRNKNSQKTINVRSSTSISSIRNIILSHFRTQNKKHLFMLFSNNAVTLPDFFKDVIDTASFFGTWCITGKGSKNLPVEDEEAGKFLNISPELNPSFVYMHSAIVKKNGYFNEQLICDDPLDMIDYVNRLRNLKLYTPSHFNPSIKDGLYISDSRLSKNGLKKESLDIEAKLSFGMFHHLYKYIPGYEEPSGASQEVLMDRLEYLQKNYSQPTQ